MEICREMRNSEFLEDGVEGILGNGRIDAELKKRQVDHSAPWPSSWLRPAFPLYFSMMIMIILRGSLTEGIRLLLLSHK